MTDKICTGGHVYNQEKCDRCGGVEAPVVASNEAQVLSDTTGTTPVSKTRKTRVTKPKAVKVKKVAKKVKGKK